MTISTHPSGAGIIFVTGTDTGVGKTLLTGLLLYHLRKSGIHTLATKPFSCGGLSDVNLFAELQDRELTREEINPFAFEDPVAPLVAARVCKRNVEPSEVVTRVQDMRSRCDCLLVEGIGGVLVPLSEGFSVLDLITALNGCVVVAARNKVGTINHTLLTIDALRHAGLTRMKVVLMNPSRPDVSTFSNEKVLSELLGSPGVFSIPFLGAAASTAAGIKKSHKKIKKTLARVADFDSFTALFSSRDTTVSKDGR